MCGIVGILDPRRCRAPEATEALLTDLALQMAARGPDDAGTWVDAAAGIGFGHRRLSILDLSVAGAQPMVSADGRWVLTYNGEIYDHHELAADLDAAGVIRRGHSDTEVLVEAVARWGLDHVLGRIDGMYAFGLWDRRERRLTLVRDRLGEKPLYYGTLGSGEFVFASTLDVLRAHPAFDRPVDRDALALYFRHKYVPAPWSIYQGIRKLEPGCRLEVDAEGRPGVAQPYWSFLEVAGRGTTWSGSAEDAVDRLDELLRRSVRRRMVADVPVGAFLSGGIDSSTVVAVAQQESSTAVRTFTVGSSSVEYDESTEARAVARHLGTAHTELTVSDTDARSALDRLGNVYDEPFGDSSQIPTLLVAELARRSVTVALSGDGGDELFAGYNRHVWVPAIWNRLAPVPVGVRRVAAGAARRVPPSAWDSAARVLPARRRPRQAGLKVAKVLGIADAASAEEVYGRLVSHWQNPTALVRGADEPPTLHTDPSRWPAVDGIVAHMCALDTVTYLPDDILVKVDRATMAASLEGRIPLLDRDLVEFAASLPVDLRIREGRAKWPLRRVLARYVPEALFERPKSGFGVPIEQWLRGPLRTWAEERLFSTATRSFLDGEVLRRTWADHQSGRRDNAYELWDVLSFASWCDARGMTEV